MQYDLTKARSHLITGRKPNNKNLKTCAQTLAEMGLNPFYEIARLAVIAEKEKDLGTASTNWRFLGEYVDAKRKAIDLAENALKQKQLMTLDEIQRIKQAILEGTIMAIPVQQVIDQEPAENHEFI